MRSSYVLRNPPKLGNLETIVLIWWQQLYHNTMADSGLHTTTARIKASIVDYIIVWAR
jgi:hypothetical protein